MSLRSTDFESNAPALEAFLLGHIAFDQALELQLRLIEQCRNRDDGQIILLLCEHPPIITVGRGGSPGDVAMHNNLVRNRQIEVRWVNRGGGCFVHCTGQLAIYPIIPLRWHGFSVGQFLERFQAGIFETLGDLNVRSCIAPETLVSNKEPTAVGEPCPIPSADQNAAVPGAAGRLGIWGRTGQLATIGVAVRHWVTYYGAYLNVCPPTGLLRLVKSDPLGQTMMSSLVAEHCGSVRMPTVRAALIQRLAQTFGCDRYHLYTGHPMLRKSAVRMTRRSERNEG
jgi:lipoyl(octanoyl) transferase